MRPQSWPVRDQHTPHAASQPVRATGHPQPRRTRQLGVLVAAGAAIVPMALISAPTANAQSTARAAVSSTSVSLAGSTAASSSNSSAVPKLTTTAWAAGKARYGASVTQQQAIAAYWTPSRMRAAVSVSKAPFLQEAYAEHAKRKAALISKAKLDARRGVERSAPTGTRVTVQPQAGKLTSSGLLTAPRKAGKLAAYDPGYGYSHPTARTNGKVFFTMAGRNYVCSASVINSEGKKTVWSAGHCVHGGRGGSWAYNWTFVPSYDDDLANPAPYGYWYARQLWSRTAWINDSDFSQDMGVAIMHPRNGWNIVSYFGGQGFTVNRGKKVWEYAFGYPAEAPFDGGNLKICWGTSSPEWEVLWWSSDTIKIPCDMTRGSSGGPWLYSWNGSWGYLNGVNSRIDRIVGPTIMLSPYFDDDALSLYNATRNL